MWETVVLHGLSRCGNLKSEVALGSGRRPDVHFSAAALSFVADVTAVSDEGLDEENPFQALMSEIEATKKKIGLPMGGLDVQVRSRLERKKRGSRTVLQLPKRRAIADFVRLKVEPLIRAAANEGQFPIRISIDNEDAGVDITIDPSKSAFNSGSYAAYSIPMIRDQNPLYNALKAKARQLRGAPGLTGIFVGDGDSASMARARYHQQAVSPAEIVGEFFRQFSSVDFVVLMGVSEVLSPLMYHQAPDLKNEISVFVRPDCEHTQLIEEAIRGMVEQFPAPGMTPVNAAHRARESDYWLGFHGGYQMNRDDTVRIGLREFTEIFAGLRTLADQGSKTVPAHPSLHDKPNIIQNVIRNHLANGRLPVALEVIKGSEDENDDWVDIRFGDPDPAISPLR